MANIYLFLAIIYKIVSYLILLKIGIKVLAIKDDSKILQSKSIHLENHT